MPSNLKFFPLPDGASISQTRDTQLMGDSQLDGALIRIQPGVFNRNVTLVVKGDGLQRVSPLGGEFAEWVSTQNELCLTTTSLDIDLEVYSEIGSGPFTVLVVLDQAIEKYDDFS